MSGIGAALAGLVGGYQQGRNTRHAWDDRNTENERKKRRDEILDAQERRAEEAHRMGMGASRRDLKAWDRQWEDAEGIRNAIAKDMALAEAGMIPMGATPSGSTDATGAARPMIGGDNPVMAAAKRPAASIIQPAAMGSTPAAAPVRAATVPMGAFPPNAGSGASGSIWDRLGQGLPRATMEQVAAGGVAGAVAGMPMGATPEGSFLMQGPDGKAYATRGPRNAAEKAQLADLAKAGQLGVAPEGAAGAQALDKRFNATHGKEYSWLVPGEAGNDMRRLGSGIESAFSAVPRANEAIAEGVANTGVDALNAFTAPYRGLSRWIHGEDPKFDPMQRVDLNDNGVTAASYSPAFDLVRKMSGGKKEAPEEAAAGLKAEQAKTPAQQEMAASAADAVEALAENPGTKALAEGVTLQALGATPGRPMTAAQLDRGTKDFMKSFRETGAPNMVRALLRQGNIEGAQSLETFLRSAEAQKGTELWIKGTVQALTGDTVGAAETFIETFNTPGYYDDGYEILRDQSDIIKDKAGRAIGARLTFRNQATGETFVRDMSPEEMGR